MLGIGMLACFARAQDPEAGEKKELPSRQVRFLAVGDMPPFRQEVRNGVRIQLKAPPGSIPPPLVSVTVGQDDEEEQLAGTSRLQLGRVSAALEVPGGDGFLTIREGEEGGRAWLKVKRPEIGDFLVLLWRDPKTKTWDQSKALALPENPKAGLVTFVNLAPGPVALVYDGQKIGLAAGRRLVKRLPAGRAIEFQAGVADGRGGLRRLTKRALQQAKNDRTLMVFSLSDGEKPRQPVKITEIREAGQP